MVCEFYLNKAVFKKKNLKPEINTSILMPTHP